MLKIKSVSEYTNEKGTDVFVYTVTGSEEELDNFKEAKGTYYREADGETEGVPEGTPLWFTPDYIGETGSLLITSKGKVIANRSAFKKAKSLAKQFGADAGVAMANLTVASLLTQIGVKSNNSTSTAKKVVAEEVEEVENLDEV